MLIQSYGDSCWALGGPKCLFNLMVIFDGHLEGRSAYSILW